MVHTLRVIDSFLNVKVFLFKCIFAHNTSRLRNKLQARKSDQVQKKRKKSTNE